MIMLSFSLILLSSTLRIVYYISDGESACVILFRYRDRELEANRIS